MISNIFDEILPLFAAGLFLGFFFYKTDWSLLGPIIFRAGILLYLLFSPVLVTSLWWVTLTFTMMGYAFLIVVLDSTIKEPKYLKRRYGLIEG